MTPSDLRAQSKRGGMLGKKDDTRERLKGAPDADKIMIARAVECHEKGTEGRIRLNAIKGRGRLPLHAFVAATTGRYSACFRS